ncbi:MAG: GTPase HflX, partial [Polaribacter sp.]|nr:GTPase HflX [Polaribacter sp.]
MIDQREAISEKTVLIGVITQQQDESKSTEYLDELEFLTKTAGGIAVKRFVQKMEKPNPKTFLGVGKLDEVKNYIEAKGIGTAIFDDELSPAQIRNIQK